jgi:hypothetical protein
MCVFLSFPTLDFKNCRSALFYFQNCHGALLKLRNCRSALPFHEKSPAVFKMPLKGCRAPSNP